MRTRISLLAALAVALVSLLLAQPGGLDAEEARDVVIRYENSEVTSVHIVGSFNNWRPEASPLRKSDKDAWTITLLLSPGVYRYMLVLDGKDWVVDPRARQTAPDGFGSYNSLLTVE